MSRALVVAAILAFGARTAHADEAPAPETEGTEEVSNQRRAAAIGVAIFPGVVVHGAGSWVLGEKRAAKRLAITGWIGLAALGVGGGAIGITGGNREMVLVGLPLIIAGAGLMFPPWFADIWYASGGSRARGTPHSASTWSIELGTTWLHDAYRERALARAAGRIELGRAGLRASTLIDPEGNASSSDLETRVRILGAPATDATVADASNLFVRAALRRHVDHDDNVAIATADADVGMRLDLQRIDRILEGNFLEVSFGMGIERVRYAGTVTDYNSLFLGRFGWGLYLGTRSEIIAFYDHRRDSLAGGIAAGRAAGFVGSVGASVDLRLGGPWAFAGELEIGNAWVTTFAIRYHGGPL